MNKFIKKFGGWIFNFHVFQGILIYFIVLLHPLFFMAYNHFIAHGWDLYAVFINACLICDNLYGYYYTLGIVSFWLLTVTVLTGLFRKSTPWMKKNWRSLHVINYIIFLIIGVHGFFIGVDFRYKPFYPFAIVAYAAVAGIIIFIEIPRLYKNFRAWLRS